MLNKRSNTNVHIIQTGFAHIIKIMTKVYLKVCNTRPYVYVIISLMQICSSLLFICQIHIV